MAHRICFHGYKNVQLEKIDLPQLGPQDVMLKTICSAISPGSERLIYQGRFPHNQPVDVNFPDQAQPFGFPMTYGYSLVGEIVDTGTEVSEDYLGKRVFAFKPHQDWAVCNLRELVLLPADMDPLDACFLANAETAINLILDTAPLMGEKVAVLGQGVVGLLTTSILSRFPLDTSLAVDSIAPRLDQARDMGAGIALKPDELADFQQQFDAVIELTGKVEAVETAINLCHYDGRIVVGSWFGEDGHTLTLNTHFHRSRIQIISSQVSTIHPALRGRFNSQRRLDLALNHLKRLKPSRLISHRFAFSREQITEAYHLLDHPSPLHLQMVFTYRHR